MILSFFSLFAFADEQVVHVLYIKSDEHKEVKKEIKEEKQFQEKIYSVDDQKYIEAGQNYEINYLLLKAIAQTESGQNPRALNCANRNGSCDYGIMQINSIHLPTLKTQGITVEKLFDEKINIQVGARVLKGCIQRYGFTYKTLNCYNGKINGNDYYTRVIKNYNRLVKSVQ